MALENRHEMQIETLKVATTCKPVRIGADANPSFDGTGANMRRRIWIALRALQSPWANAACAAVLLSASALVFVPRGQYASTCGQWVQRQVLKRNPRGMSLAPGRTWGYHVKDDWIFAGMVHSTHAPLDYSRYINFVYDDRPRRTGFWALTRIVEGERLVPWAPPGVVSPAMFLPARRALALSEPKFAHLGERDALTSRILWGGIALNTATIVALMGFLWSIVWVPRGYVRFIRGRRRRIGLCPNCRYDLAGLTSDTCPECGSVVDHSNRGEPSAD